MKVCDVVCNSVWYDPRVRKQIVEYINQGIEVVCVGYECFRFNEEKVKTIPCPTTIVRSDTRYLGKQKSVIKKLLREKARNQAICDAIIAQKPDIIHANDLTGLIPAFMAQKKLKCKLVYDSHEIFTENNTVRDKPLYKTYLKIQEKKMIKKLDLMICVSHAAAEYFAKTYKIKKPMVVTNCALRNENFTGNVKKNEGFEILNHGQFYEGRGYELMIETAPYLKDFSEIQMALRGFGVLEESLKQRVDQIQASNVRFYPKVLVQELIPMAAKSYVGVAITEPICLNFELSVSNKLFEYAAAGLPVIMSDIPEHRYLNDKYQFGIILKDNTPQCFAEAVKKLYLDKDFYNTCATNAKRLSEEVNWENEFKKLICIEKEIVNGKK